MSVVCLLRDATPDSQCQAGAAERAEGGRSPPPAGRAAGRACCTAGTLSSPPAT